MSVSRGESLIGREFADAARAYVAALESPSESGDSFLRLIERLLARLVFEAAGLPEVEPTSPGPAVSPHRPELHVGDRLGIADVYWMVWDPWPDDEDPEVVAGSLGDDLSEVYRDVVRGLALWDAGDRNDAVWEWRSSFSSNWGRDAVSALWALRYRTD